jgi:hypothetical protein
MKNNDQAFPVGYNGHEGMTLRDYFAAKAMQSLILTKHYQNLATDHPALLDEMFVTLAGEAYDYAQAMLETRSS